MEMTAAAIAQLFATYGPWGVSGFMAWLFLRSEKKRDDERVAYLSHLQLKDKETRDLSNQVVAVATNANANNAGLIAVLGASPRK